MPIFIRLTNYKSSEEKERGFFDPKNRFIAKQEVFFKIPGAPIAYWVSDRVREIFEKSEKLLNNAKFSNGINTGDNDNFLKLWYEIEYYKIGFNISNFFEAKNSMKKWFPYNKGGEFQKWYGNNEYLINWENDGEKIKKFAVIRNKGGHWSRYLCGMDYHFKESITWSFVSSSNFGIRFKEKGFMFDVGGSSMFPNKKEYFYYFGAFFNTKISFYFLKNINPTLNFQTGNIAKLPIIFPKSEQTKQKIDQLTEECIDISKEEWDSRETSWDFTKNELLKHKTDGKIETAYENYCEFWREKFYKLHQNEEELNRLFINIYELQDELTPDVPLEDITILKKEAKIVNGELEFNKDEIIKQFISYAVGVMFGRYSLDHEGLRIADMGASIKEANEKFDIQNTTFEIDDDNIIPVLEDEYFSDDIVARFRKFLEITFGKEHLIENLNFIQEALGMDIRKYFYKEFIKDHIQRYKKRPIYWMITSPNKTFQALIYMHRYYPDIFAKVRNDYLLELIVKLNTQKEYLYNQLDSAISNSEKKKIDKQIKEIEKKLKELYEFDKNYLEKYANNLIDINLDDGVKVNYCKFKDILYPISGLCKGK
ncbi:BREX-1 system adenine-specific DNA-methyltransferase PglX [Nitratiruptor sp. SB155-2]|uniref:BREX-1 system adenine-specific DNA-methyltransferase PglX n=1 Tax=Nitratiruptor sp. (strain SB155-2) TaxID=387092 RepID=UPI000682D055|nr:BREX-1 system adenine-specific DNA-methyltransferase PglX [Nitratiruptor sp. SB155-2]